MGDLFQIARVAALVFVAVTLVVLGDTAGKALLQMQEAHPFTIAWSRFAIAAVLVVALVRLSRDDWHVMADPRALLRALFIAGGIASIMTALRTEPIAMVYGAFFIGPIVSYILAIVLLGERPSRLRSVLLGLGFVGVLLVVKPGFGAKPGIFFAVFAGLCYGAYLASTRWVAGQHRSVALLSSQLIVGAVVLLPLGLSAPVPVWSGAVVWLLLASAVASAAGNYLLVIANEQAEASLIAPLVYSQLIAATAVGVLVFGDWPDTVSLIGITLIAFSGFLTVLEARK